MFDVFRPYVLQLRSMPGLEGPMVRWGIVGIVFILLWAMLFEPYLDWRTGQAAMLDSQAAKLERLQALTEASDSWKQADVVFKQRTENLKGLFFQGSSYAVSQTDLLQYIRKDIGKFHLVIESQRLLDAEPMPKIGEKAAIYLRLHGKLSDMLAFADALSRSPKLLSIDSLYIAKLRKDEALMQLELAAYRLLATVKDS